MNSQVCFTTFAVIAVIASVANAHFSQDTPQSANAFVVKSTVDMPYKGVDATPQTMTITQRTHSNKQYPKIQSSMMKSKTITRSSMRQQQGNKLYASPARKQVLHLTKRPIQKSVAKSTTTPSMTSDCSGKKTVHTVTKTTAPKTITKDYVDQKKVVQKSVKTSDCDEYKTVKPKVVTKTLPQDYGYKPAHVIRSSSSSVSSSSTNYKAGSSRNSGKTFHTSDSSSAPKTSAGFAATATLLALVSFFF